MTLPNPTLDNAPNETPFWLMIAALCAFVFGVLMAVFSGTYAQDLAILRDAPDLIWSWACGSPRDDNVTLPLLLTMSLLGFLSSGLLMAVRVWFTHTEKRKRGNP